MTLLLAMSHSSNEDKILLLSASEHQKLKGSKNLSVRSAEELPVEKHLEHLLSFYAPQNFNEITALVYELI